MQSPLLSHVLAVEFPELAPAIHYLKMNDAHFSKLMNDHDAVDEQITKSEEGLTFLSDSEMTALKLKRLHLKEELTRKATAHKNA